MEYEMDSYDKVNERREGGWYWGCFGQSLDTNKII